ncbi:MAG: NAD-dependent epimerase/dehydratase family protein [Candidatus Staskawiczbacteria bacterium]|nr:NAD-dependent epimerase/dehydratase family protein [Candidatus Staskawiczbacteria bacterium]
MSKYFIIGGAGFIGSHLSEKLFNLGNQVVVLDNFSTGNKKNINEKITFHAINIDDEKELEKVFSKEKPDVVFHLAGVINLRRKIDDPLFESDLDFLSRTEKIIKACSKVNVKKIVFISSGGAIYQNATQVPTKESYLAHPSSLYGLANLMIEKYIEIFCKTKKINYALLRLGNVYGPRQWTTGIIPSLILSLKNNESPVIYGDGTQTRDFIYIDDVVEGIIASAEKLGSETYNLGSGKEISLNQAFKTIGDLLNIKGIKPMYMEVNDQDTKRSSLDISKIEKETDWHPIVAFEDGLKKTIEWFKNN